MVLTLAPLGHGAAGVPWPLGRVTVEWRQNTDAGGWRAGGLRRRRGCGNGAGRGVGTRPTPASGHLAARGPLSSAFRALARGRAGSCGRGELADAGSELGDALAVLLQLLDLRVVPLALLARPRPQVLGCPA